jgi:hypothetical protein
LRSSRVIKVYQLAPLCLKEYQLAPSSCQAPPRFRALPLFRGLPQLPPLHRLRPAVGVTKRFSPA